MKKYFFALFHFNYFFSTHGHIPAIFNFLDYHIAKAPAFQNIPRLSLFWKVEIRVKESGRTGFSPDWLENPTRVFSFTQINPIICR